MHTFVFCLLVTVVAAEPFSGNRLVDEFLAVIRSRAESYVAPLIVYHPFLKMYDIECSSGKFLGLSEIRRAGNTTVTNEGGRLTLRTIVGIDPLRVISNNCVVEGPRVTWFRIHVSSSFYIFLSLKCEGNQCVGKIDKIEVKKFHVKDVMTGDGSLRHKLNNGLKQSPYKLLKDVDVMLKSIADNVCTVK